MNEENVQQALERAREAYRADGTQESYALLKAKTCRGFSLAQYNRQSMLSESLTQVMNRYRKIDVKDVEGYDLRKQSVFIRNIYKNPVWYKYPSIFHEDIEAENFFLFDKDAPITGKVPTVKVYPSSKTTLHGF